MATTHAIHADQRSFRREGSTQPYSLTDHVLLVISRTKTATRNSCDSHKNLLTCSRLACAHTRPHSVYLTQKMSKAR